jgi:FkbM family methyltransferase
MSKFIFDIGMHNGQDTKLYLNSGFKVIAVEANPYLVELAKKNFEKEIENGQLILLNVGINNISNTEILFYKNINKSEWSSFDYKAASKNSSKIEKIYVKTITLDDLINTYGIPYYLKIDIESYDTVCLESLFNFKSLPKYISCEASSIKNIEILNILGYKNFKLINQSWFHKPININMEKNLLFPYFNLIVNIIRKRLVFVLDFKYPVGSSGPFAENTKGNWLTYEEIYSLYTKFYFNDQGLNKQSWFDIHAKM